MLDDGRRHELLAAIGIDVYRLRAAPARGAVADAGAAAVAAAGAAARPAAAVGPRVVIACSAAARRDAKLAAPLAHLVRALGVGAAEAAWVETDGERPGGAVPEVSCYLMLGADVARACSAQLSLERQGTATIAVAAEAHELFRDAAGRRALWQTVKPLARRLCQARDA
jgi:hypothetical protein